MDLVPAVPPMQVVDDRPLQQFQKAVGQLTAAVEAFVDDEPLFIQLPVIHPDELQLTSAAGVRHVDIAELTV